MSSTVLRLGTRSAGVATLVLALGGALLAAEPDFVATVVSSRPVAYYRLGSASGKSEVGATQFNASGGVTSGEPGTPVGAAHSRFARLDGRDGYLVTTQAGGVGAEASIMAWVNFDSLPSTERHFFYVAGESENANDLDVQFETDNVLKFYTAAGGNVSYAAAPDTLVHQWHMIVATLDTAKRTRTLYWDGKPVSSDQGGGRAGKTGTFSIGASTVFPGRFLKGGVAEVALWYRSLTASEVATIYGARGSNSAAAVPSSGPGPVEPAPSGPFATSAKVAVADSNGPINLKREEQIALMFLTAMQQIEGECQRTLNRACTLDQIVSGAVPENGARLGRLKFNPQTDPNYAYTLAASGMAWEAHANARKPGLGGFYFVSRYFPNIEVAYNPSGSASAIDKALTERSIEGDSFETR